MFSITAAANAVNSNGTTPDTFNIATFANVERKKPNPLTITWPQLCQRLTTHTQRPNKDGELFAPVTFKPGTTRAKANVETVDAFVLDFDNGFAPDDFCDTWRARGLSFVVYSTHSHTPDFPKFRAVFPFAAPVDTTQWEKTYAKLAAALGGGAVDPSCKDASRIYYFPSCPPERRNDAFTFVNDGAPLNPDDFAELEPKPLETPAPRQIEYSMNGASGNGYSKTRLEKYAAAATQKELDKLTRSPEGGRNVQLNKTAFALGQLVGAGILDRAHVENELTATAHGIGLNGVETARTIQSGLTAGQEKPRQLPEPRAAQINGVLTTSRTAVIETQIPAPASINAQGKPEYDERQLVEILHPQWPVTSLGSNAAHAQRIAHYLGDILAYNKALGYVCHNGKNWQQDDKAATGACGLVAPLSMKTREEAAALLQLAGGLTIADRAPHAAAMTQAAMRLAKQAKQSEAKGFIEGALHLAASKLSVPIDCFDQKPWLIGFQNGTWARGQWREHRRGDFLLYLSPIEIDFKLDRSEWLQVLERITGNDADFARTLQDAAAYILSGASHLRTILWLYGPRGTGKSTFTELLQTLLNEMAVSVDPKYLQGDSARERLGASIWNKRLAVCAEAGSQRIESELLKTLSGGDSFPVRFLHREGFTAKPRHVLMMVANDPPRMDAYDDALRDRVLALPFVHPLNNGAPLELTGGNRIEAVRQDPASPLVRGFAAWALEGLQRFYKAQEIYRAPVVEAACAKFWQDTDPITPFWENVTAEELHAGIVKSDLRRRYENWCITEGARALGRDRWTRACEAHGLYEWRSNGVRYWRK